MGALPTWIGEGGLAGFLHLPDTGRARAAVLICPSLGSEQAWTYRGLRHLAESLCASGMAVLRFDYGGTGHSAGDLEHMPECDLAGDVVEAGRYLARAGIEPTVAVAYGIGGAILAEAAGSELQLDSLVLWEPALSGRRWLREQNALLRLGQPELSVPAEPRSGMEVAGLVVSPYLRSTLQAMTVAVERLAAHQVLVVAQPGSPAFELASQPTTESLVSTDTKELLFGHRLPRTTTGRIVDWVDRRCSGEPWRPVHQPTRVTERQLETSFGPVRERFLPDGSGWFGVVAEPLDGASEDPVVFITTAVEPALGPGREWVRLARELAASGRSAYRVDLPGFGDSPARAGQLPDSVYPPGATDDLLDVVAQVTGGRPDRAAVVGMCSGAYHALCAGSRTRLAQVCAISPVLRPRAEVVGRPIGGDESRTILRRLRSWADGARWRIPLPGSRRAPAVDLEALDAFGTSALLLYGYEDYEETGRIRGLRRLAASGRLNVLTEPRLSHAALTADERQLVARTLRVRLGRSETTAGQTGRQ